ncbi:MAG TPA: GTPase [Thermodesulfobacteriota bacterium]|nr:GTPase [Thermodesulfobacteriota bacterium]
MKRKRIVIMGAAGRDFHNFNVCFRDDPSVEVVAFTAAQIPFIERRTFPPELSGPLYPAGIEIHPEEELPGLIKALGVDEVVFSYSDVSHEYVMHRASMCTALGADFTLLGAERTMLEAKRPVVTVCAVRTGCGKSAVTRFVAKKIKEAGRTPVALRHPMPYGELSKKRLQRFASLKEIKDAGCTMEEMEEFEPLVSAGVVVYAGVDYRAILEEAEKEADVIVWDGGNNDLPFIKPDLELVVADPLRPGHELAYYPGEANLRRADCLVVNKANSAEEKDISTVIENARRVNPDCLVVRTASVIKVEGDIAGKRVLVIEDGPTLTHGGMTYGAGSMAAASHGAEAVDPRPYAVGSVRETLDRFPELKNLLPAVGYSKEQIKELEETVNSTPCDLVLVATPVNLKEVMEIKKPAIRVSYEVEDMEEPGLSGVIKEFIERSF